MTLLGGLLTLVAMQPAQANHGSFKLEVTRELSSASVGGTITLKANLVQVSGVPGSADSGGDVNIDFEIEGGTADLEGGLATPEVPDYTCTTVPAVLNSTTHTITPAQCTVTILNVSSQPGSSLVRAWIDHDINDATVTADPTEARLSDPNTDCVTELPSPVGTGNSNRSDYNACTSTSDGAAAPGRVAERDETDVVRVTFTRPGAALLLDCPELTVGPIEDSIVVRCRVFDADDLARSGVLVDGVHETGANDPNGEGPMSPGSADYNGGAASDESGHAFVTVRTTASPGFETGPAEICAWIDDSNPADDDSVGSSNKSYDTGGGQDDGGLCDAGEPNVGQADGTDNKTDQFEVEWQRRRAEVLDVTPEVGTTSTVGGTHTMTATVFDQFGAKWTASNTVVSGEFFLASPKDTDGNTPGSPDLTSCNTTSGDSDDDKATCTFTYQSAASAETDVMCFWFGATPTMEGSGSGGASCNGERVFSGTDVPAIDVVAKSWTAQASTTPTTTTTPPAEDVSKTQGYTLVGADGGIYNFGTSQFHGSTGSMKLNQPVIGLANKKGGTGYWLVARDGGIFTFGDAEFFGSTGSMKLNAPILGMEATPSGKGYFLFAADGGIFTFGDAQFHGSTGDMKLNAPAVGLSINEKGDGYWLVAQDGGIFSFGKVPFHGSTGSMKLNQPVFDMAPTAGDKGYWLVAKDGGIFSFGDAESKFYGSAVGSANGTVIGMGTTPTFNGYWIADSAGGVFPFGDARALGDRRGQANNAPIVGFATVPK